jgi:hypothetical protein
LCYEDKFIQQIFILSVYYILSTALNGCGSIFQVISLDSFLMWKSFWTHNHGFPCLIWEQWLYDPTVSCQSMLKNLTFSHFWFFNLKFSLKRWLSRNNWHQKLFKAIIIGILRNSQNILDTWQLFYQLDNLPGLYQFKNLLIWGGRRGDLFIYIT